MWAGAWCGMLCLLQYEAMVGQAPYVGMHMSSKIMTVASGRCCIGCCCSSLLMRMACWLFGLVFKGRQRLHHLSGCWCVCSCTVAAKEARLCQTGTASRGQQGAACSRKVACCCTFLACPLCLSFCHSRTCLCPNIVVLLRADPMHLLPAHLGLPARVCVATIFVLCWVHW